MSYSTIELAYDGDVATITLNRPDKRNAISFELIDDLLSALDEVEKSKAIVLILTGSGKAFCSGMDLDNLKSLLGRTLEQNVEDSRTMVRLFRSLYEFPKVTIAAVNGPAIAGGTGLALLCDFTLAVPEAKFGYTEVRIGFVPAIVSTFLLRQVGEKQARDLLLTGRIFGVEEAIPNGLDYRNRSARATAEPCPRVGIRAHRKQFSLASRHKTTAHRSCARRTGRADRSRHSRKCCYSQHRRFP